MQTDTICSKRDRGCVRNLANFYTKDGKEVHKTVFAVTKIELIETKAPKVA